MTIRSKEEAGVIVVSTGGYTFSVDGRGHGWTLGAGDGGAPILTANRALPLTPELGDAEVVFDGVSAALEPAGRSGACRLVLNACITRPFNGLLRNEIIFLEDRFIVNGWYRLDRSHALAHWCVAGQGSRLQADAVQAYLGVHGQVDEINGTVWPASAVELSTASHNWMYAGGVPRVVLIRGAESVCIGGTEIAGDFGLELRAHDGVVGHFRFNGGGRAAAQPVAAGAVVRSPRLQVLWTHALSHDRVHAAFTRTMIDDGIVPPKRYRPEDLAWRRPWYCTWADQMGLSDAAMAQEQSGQRDYQAIKDVLTQEMVRGVAGLIREKGLNIGTIIIDDGWQDFRGDWNLDVRKFPDMRGLVDALHDMGFKVVLWWAPFAAEDQAAVRKRPGFTTGPCPTYGQFNMNYSRKDVRDWAEEKWETWFSNGPGGWDIDGLKLDFLVEQIYAPTHSSEAGSRGEERLWKQLLGGLDAVIRRYKLSPGLLHVPFNPHFTPFCAAVHGEERFDRHLGYLAFRRAMYEALIPGVWYAPHFNYNPGIVPDFIREVKRSGGIVQVGKLISPDVTPDILEQIRELLKDAH